MRKKAGSIDRFTTLLSCFRSGTNYSIVVVDFGLVFILLHILFFKRRLIGLIRFDSFDVVFVDIYVTFERSRGMDG